MGERKYFQAKERIKKKSVSGTKAAKERIRKDREEFLNSEFYKQKVLDDIAREKIAVRFSLDLEAMHQKYLEFENWLFDRTLD